MRNRTSKAKRALPTFPTFPTFGQCGTRRCTLGAYDLMRLRSIAWLRPAHRPTMSESNDSDDGADSDELPYPGEAEPRSPTDLYITTSRGATDRTRHVWGTTNDGLMKTVCGSKNKIEDEGQFVTCNARELFLSHVVTDGRLCKTCRGSADLDNHVDLEEIEHFIDGLLGDDDGGEAAEPVPELPGDAQETIPVSINVDLEAELPTSERTYQLLETLGTAAAKQTALSRQNDDVIDVESLESDDE